MSRRKIRVLQFPIVNRNGGTTRYATGLWNWIDHDRFQFDYATTSPKLDFEDELLRKGAGVYYVSCRAEDDREQFVRKISQVLENRYDIVHLHTNYWKSFQVEELAMKYHVPRIIVHSHNTGVGDLCGEKRTQATAAHNILREEISEKYATDFWACSEEAADWLFGKNVPKDKIQIMRNAIDVDKYRYKEGIRIKMRSELGLDGKFVVGCVGSFIYQKNTEFLLRSFAMAHRKNTSLRLALVGDGELRNDLEYMARDLRIDEAVQFLGRRTDVCDLYQAFDLFALPSRFEGLGMVLIEAQAAGLPCLASDMVPAGAKITDLMEYLPLSEEIWAGRILEIAAQSHVRRDMRDEITVAGYDAYTQIKVVEAAYADGLQI